MEPNISKETSSTSPKVKLRNILVASVIGIFVIMMFLVTIFKLGPAIFERGL